MSDIKPLLAAEFSSQQRFRKHYLLAGIFAAFLLLLVGWYVYLTQTAQQELAKALAETDQLDPHWRLADLEAQRDRPSPDSNSALVVLAASKLLPADFPRWEYPITPTPGPSPKGDPGKAILDPLDSAEWRQQLRESFLDLDPARLLHPEQAAALRAELNRAADTVAEARKLVNLPKGRYSILWGKDFISTLLPHLQEARKVTNVLGWDTVLRAYDNDLDGALDSCLGILNCGRSIGEEPTSVSQFVRLAIRAIAVRRLELAMAQGQPPASALEQLQKELIDEAEKPCLLHALRGERAITDSTLESLLSGDVSLGRLHALGLMNTGLADGSPVLSALKQLQVLMPGALEKGRATMLRRMNQAVEAAKLPPEQHRARLAELGSSSGKTPILVRLLWPAMDRLAEASGRSTADLRCAAAALAAERFRRDNGHWPQSLDELAPRYLPAVPLDPFDGNPLRLTAFTEGIVIYSIGVNGKDDGGQVVQFKEGPASDVGFRLWHVQHRRQPPRPFPRPEAPGAVGKHLSAEGEKKDN